MTDAPKFAGWAILELMGHVRLAGYVREATLAGVGVIRVDVPTGPKPDAPFVVEAPYHTQFYGPSALYCLTPVSEEVARRAAESAPAPVRAWEVPRAALPPAAPEGGGDAAAGHEWDEADWGPFTGEGG